MKIIDPGHRMPVMRSPEELLNEDETGRQSFGQTK